MQILSEQAVSHPKRYLWGAGLMSAVLLILVTLPSLWPSQFPLLNPLQIDTDPENMLEADEPVRVLHNAMRKEFSLYDIVVVGVVNNSNPQGVFNVQSLNNVYRLAEYASTLRWEQGDSSEGVVAVDMIAPSTVDNIEQDGLGAVRFEWLMSEPPQTEAEALAIAEKAQRLPFLDDTLISRDRRAVALYIPITSKSISYRVASALQEKTAEFAGDDEFYVTGLPVAQDQFGVEMFVQMAVSAPLAMLLIFALMWLFFRNIVLVVSPMVVALISVIATMGLLIVTGNTVHIMSSMIPIFIMPIAVLDAVHILSDFFDRYPKNRDRLQTVREVMDELSRPMLFTSLTTSVGFASLALTPIPPVQVFGLFVGLGVLIAWLLTVTLIPAYIMLMPEASLAGFGLNESASGGAPRQTLLTRLLHRTGRFTWQHSKLIVGVSLLLCVGAWYGITQIRINDNPVKWFSETHEIRIADRALNERFGGTYMAYLALQPGSSELDYSRYSADLQARLVQLEPKIGGAVAALLTEKAAQAADKPALIELTRDAISEIQDQPISDEEWDAWENVALGLDQELLSDQVFKRPDVLAYIERLQQHLLDTGLVGKSNALPDIVKTVHRELLLGADEEYRIPDSAAAVAQTLITYESSHRPQDLWHFVTPDFRKTNLWIQLKSGDNIDMNAVVTSVDRYLAANPAPVELEHDWFGLTYINVIWQQKMVSGMLSAFLGSFVIVLALMVLLFRSLWWGLLSMVPLTMTIGVTYGIIGIIGKDYDMPVAVLSSLSLGLAVDYAIHFLARSRELRSRFDSWKDTLGAVFEEPARAISRNIVVIGCGFLPLLAAPLVPYKTVGVFISTILILAGAATLLILPALITLFQNRLFKQSEGVER
ncbi:MAG: MMPL family transporter [Gammaproteobacteria bacterium]|nr:MMPL family transporter [Pseudomonadales bacterium]